MAQRSVAEDLFEWPTDAPRLRATRCEDCAFITFPPQKTCPSCGGERVTPTALSRTGTLWTWTRQRFQPKNPPYIGREPSKEFVPYGVGYIELLEGRVEARIAGDVDQELRIGMLMELTVVPFATDEDGTEVLTFAFRPVEGS
ncbi:MAG: Zn-ribbon domain-containing OB-fold protein [Acidimicrobiales bacterium]